jgi:hypothetical protein
MPSGCRAKRVAPPPQTEADAGSLGKLEWVSAKDRLRWLREDRGHKEASKVSLAGPRRIIKRVEESTSVLKCVLSLPLFGLATRARWDTFLPSVKIAKGHENQGFS